MLPRLWLWLRLFERLLDGVEGAAPHVAIALVGPLGVVVEQPLVEIDLELFDGGIELSAEGAPSGRPEELSLHRAVEAFDEAVGLGPAHLGLACSMSLSAKYNS